TDIVPMYTEPAGPRFRLGPQVAFDQRAFPGGSPPPAYTRRGIVGRALVLNATEQPLAVVAARRAVVLVLKEKAIVVHANGVLFRSEHLEIAAPSVVRLRYLVHVPYRATATLTRRAVFARDGWA